jgi:hypothetical protein
LPEERLLTALFSAFGRGEGGISVPRCLKLWNGRKRNVGGGVLADGSLPRAKAHWCGRHKETSAETTFRYQANPIAKAIVCAWDSSKVVTNSKPIKDLIQLESLILAQSERWRQA